LSRHQPDDEEKTPKKKPKKSTCYGELSIEDYLKVIGAPQLADVRKTALEAGGNGSGAKASMLSTSAKHTKRLGRVAKGAVVALSILSTYAAGAEFQWDGKWSRDLTVDKAISIVDDDGYSDDRVSLAMGRIRMQINLGLQALDRATGKDGMSGEQAVSHIGDTMEQVQEIYVRVGDR